jgi:hypothetical protein
MHYRIRLLPNHWGRCDPRDARDWRKASWAPGSATLIASKRYSLPEIWPVRIQPAPISIPCSCALAVCCRNAHGYLGMDRNRFNSELREHLPIGIRGSAVKRLRNPANNAITAEEVAHLSRARGRSGSRRLGA